MVPLGSGIHSRTANEYFCFEMCAISFLRAFLFRLAAFPSTHRGGDDVSRGARKITSPDPPPSSPKQRNSYKLIIQTKSNNKLWKINKHQFAAGRLRFFFRGGFPAPHGTSSSRVEQQNTHFTHLGV